MAAPLRVLLVEDDPADAHRLREALARSAGAEVDLRHVVGLGAALVPGAADVDIVLLDLSLGDSEGVQTVAQALAALPHLPIVVLTGLFEPETGIEAVRQGAEDYLVKGEVTGPLLLRALRYAIERHRHRREHERLIAELSEALARVRALSGLLPICASCKRVRDDHGYWSQIEAYLRAHADVEFSHGLCPGCAERLYEEVALWGAAEG